jgi:hypothetical protein
VPDAVFNLLPEHYSRPVRQFVAEAASKESLFTSILRSTCVPEFKFEKRKLSNQLPAALGSLLTDSALPVIPADDGD